jgi:integrase
LQPEKGKRYILIRESFTKAHDQRVTQLSPHVAHALDMQRERQQQQREKAGMGWELTGLVLTDDYGRSQNPTTIAKQFKQIARRANLSPGFTFHGLRHLWATFLIEDGVSQRVLMQAFGHKNPRTSAHYGQVLEAANLTLFTSSTITLNPSDSLTFDVSFS